MNFVFSNVTVFELAHQSGCAQAHLVHAVAAIDHQRMLGTQALQSANLDAHQIGVKHAHQNVRRTGRIGERTQNIEDGSDAQLFAHRRHVFHGGVVVGGKHKSNAHLLHALRNFFGRQVDVDAQTLEHIGTARFTADTAPAMLGCFGASSSSHKHGAG